jgi:hypothetical protein
MARLPPQSVRSVNEIDFWPQHREASMLSAPAIRHQAGDCDIVFTPVGDRSEGYRAVQRARPHEHELALNNVANQIISRLHGSFPNVIRRLVWLAVDDRDPLYAKQCVLRVVLQALKSDREDIRGLQLDVVIHHTTELRFRT